MKIIYKEDKLVVLSVRLSVYNEKDVSSTALSTFLKRVVVELYKMQVYCCNDTFLIYNVCLTFVKLNDGKLLDLMMMIGEYNWLLGRWVASQSNNQGCLCFLISVMIVPPKTRLFERLL